MANILTPAQRNLVIEALALDKTSNYSRLEYYLKQIASGRDVTFETRSSQPFVVSSSEAWSIILIWSQGEGNLPVGDRKDLFNVRSRATKLLDYLQTNVSGKAAEAAASYQQILDQAHNKITPTTPSQDPQEYNHQKIYNLRRIQTDILQAGIIGKIYTNLEKSQILAGVPAESRNYVLRMFAAANQNLRYSAQNPAEDFTPEKIHQLLLHTPGVKDVNSIIRLFYSNAAKEDIQTIVETIESSIQEYGEAKYQKEMNSFHDLTALSPSLDSVSYLINSVDIHATSQEKIRLIQKLKSQIISSASGRHTSGEDLIKSALRSAGFPVPKDISTSTYKQLLPYLEELEIKERHILLGSDLSDHNPRFLATKSLAKEMGVRFSTPWITKKELDAVTAKIAGGKTLQEAFDLEFSKGDEANLFKLTEISDLIGKHHDYKIYHDAVDGNLWYQIREVWDKSSGGYQSTSQSIGRFKNDLWAGYTEIDDLIHAPGRNLTKWWELQQDKRPWLNPGKYIRDTWANYQTDIAVNIHKWAIGVSASSWLSTSGFAGHIADFTEGFIKHNGNWDGARSFFVQRKWGNTLNWATKTFTKHKDFKGLKVSIANTIWSGFSKMAPELSAKMMAGVLSKTITTFLAGELTLGASIAIQVAWETIKGGFSELLKFAKSVVDGNTANLYGTIPLILGSVFLAVNAALGGIPAALIIGFKLLKDALKMVWDLLLALLAVSAIVTIAAISFFALVWYGLISPTFQLDSNSSPTQIFTNIVCDEGESTSTAPTNKVASCASCLVKYLTQCYGQSVTGTKIKSQGISCIISSIITSGAADAISASATTYHNSSTDSETYLQCVGFARAAAICGGGGLPGQAVASDYIRKTTPGYKFVGGTGSCQSGDFGIIDGAIGHIFVWGNAKGALVDAIDANKVCNGCVSDKTSIPMSSVAGCLKKN